VVSPARLTRREDGNRVAEVGERSFVALEDAGGAEYLVVHPGGVAHVDDEPAVRDRGQTRVELLEPGFADHRLTPIVMLPT
jgi:hypothetical protein